MDSSATSFAYNTSKLVLATKSTAKFPEPMLTGWTFTGYKVGGEDLHDTWDYPLDVKTTDVTAQWKINKYSVRYDANGGSGYMEANKDIDYNGRFYVPNCNFTRDGWTFVNWKQRGGVKDSTTYNPSQYIDRLSSQDGDIVTLVAQ